MRNEVSPEHARIARDVGLARLRRLTGAAVAAALGLSAVFAGIAAGSTHPRRTVGSVRVRSTRRPASTPALPPAHAPSLGDNAAPSAAPTPPASSPAPAVSPPVAVSGGS
jgi:hypothetical protein